MSVNVTSKSEITTNETLEQGVAAANSPTITHLAYNNRRVLHATSVPPATKAVYFSQALTAGAATIDLTSLTGADGAIDATGLKLQEFRITNGVTTAGAVTAGNNSAVTVGPGDTNGYDLFGSGNSVVVPAGATLHFQLNENLADVASGDRTIKLAGTGTDAFEITLILG